MSPVKILRAPPNIFALINSLCINYPNWLLYYLLVLDIVGVPSMFLAVLIIHMYVSMQEIRNSNYCETTDKDSSDEQSTTSSISARVRSRGLHEKGYVYFLVRQDTWEHCWVREVIDL